MRIAILQLRRRIRLVRADLKWTSRPDAPTAVVLVLHGGQDASVRPARWTSPAVLRMVPIALAAARAGDGSFAVARLRYAVRGWNRSKASPVADGRWALEQLTDAYPGLPVALVGHSMGGRVALALADDVRVTDVIGLAPWIVGTEGLRAHPAQRTLLVHGLADRTTSAEASRRIVESLQGRGMRASFVGMTDTDHAMLRRAATWHRLVGGYLRAALVPASRSVPAAAAARLGGRASQGGLITVI